MRTLDLRGCNVVALPGGMAVLEQLCVSGCVCLDAAFLPASSARHVRRLDASGSNLLVLPGGMSALEELLVNCCCGLARDFLPASSAKSVRRLDAGCSPATLDTCSPPPSRVGGEDAVADLAALFVGVLELDARGSNLVALPCGMAALEDLCVTGCVQLARDFLPASSGERMYKPDAAGSNMVALPSHTRTGRKSRLAGLCVRVQ